MRDLRVVLPVLAVLAFSGAGSTVLAESAGKEEVKDANIDTGATVAVEDAARGKSLRLAQELIAYGDANGDALSLVLAAKIMKEQGTTKPLEGATPSESAPRYTSADEVLAKAKELASGNEAVLALVAKVEGIQTRGAGYITYADVVPARTRRSWAVTFTGGEMATVYVQGLDGTDLDLKIFDESGNYICGDVDNTNTTICTWTPRWTGQFQIMVENYGQIASSFLLFTN